MSLLFRAVPTLASISAAVVVEEFESSAEALLAELQFTDELLLFNRAVAASTAARASVVLPDASAPYRFRTCLLNVESELAVELLLLVVVRVVEVLVEVLVEAVEFAEAAAVLALAMVVSATAVAKAED